MFCLDVPLPMTYFHDLAVEEGLVDPNYWKEYTLELRNEKLPYLIPNCQEWVKIAFRKLYSRLSYLIKKALELSTWKSVIKQPQLLKGRYFADINRKKKSNGSK